ncbi:MAG: oligopeptidase A, partial [Gammaproteobacteria bacterium]|nr:oligopeptidase A [Gammaproteobacteria bacterium]
MSNPLLEKNALPPFSRIEPAHVEPAVRQLIERNKQAIENLLAANSVYTWDNLLQPIEEMEDELAQAWSPVSHLNSVRNSDALRES